MRHGWLTKIEKMMEVTATIFETGHLFRPLEIGCMEQGVGKRDFTPSL